MIGVWAKVVPSVDKRRQEMIAGNQFSILLGLSLSQWPQRANLFYATRRINFYLFPFSSESTRPRLTKKEKPLLSQAFIMKSFVHVRTANCCFCDVTQTEHNSKHWSIVGCRRRFGDHQVLCEGQKQLSHKLTCVCVRA